MSPQAIGLIIASAFMHAGWNLLARRQKSEMAFFTRMVIVVITVGFIPAIIGGKLTGSFSGKAWLCVAGSGFCAGVYLYSLAMAYGSSEFTIVYPVARALPVVLIGVTDVLRDRTLTAPGWFGVMFVASGCFLTPLNSFREFKLERYLHKSILWIFLAAMGTVGYSLLDKVASEIITSGPASAARYGYAFFCVAGLVFLTLGYLTCKDEQQNNLVGWKTSILAAVCFFGSYWLILWTYQMTRHASYVVAFRQLSIIIGVVIAFAVYKERGLGVRVTGTALITVGLFLVGLWGN
jgi:drug/metabolite transporter (DMT)-like permease